eukprot:850970-Amphidinium_carterae.1
MMRRLAARAVQELLERRMPSTRNPSRLPEEGPFSLARTGPSFEVSTRQRARATCAHLQSGSTSAWAHSEKDWLTLRTSCNGSLEIVDIGGNKPTRNASEKRRARLTRPKFTLNLLLQKAMGRPGRPPCAKDAHGCHSAV